MSAPGRKRRLSKKERQLLHKSAKVSDPAPREESAPSVGGVDGCVTPRSKDAAACGETQPEGKKKGRRKNKANGNAGEAPIALEAAADADGPAPASKKARRKAAKRRATACPDQVGVGAKRPREVPRGEEAPPAAKKHRGAQKAPAAVQAAPSPIVAKLLRELADPNVKGTLSDRLNPGHYCFDKELKASWKSLSKKERTAIVACDKQAMQAAASEASVAIEHPFSTMADDHCETAAEAYRDVAPVLKRLAKAMGKTPATLSIYDPYYCAGAMVRHLGELGFETVYNRCEDFYAVIRENRVPPHDVVVTNPPYSGDHVERLLRWCRSNGKPFLLLMPNYFCTKPYYEPALGGGSAAKSMLYLYPRKRYVYWTPKGLRERDKVQTQHSGEGGYRTSPFVSFWYLDLGPSLPAKKLLSWWLAEAQRCGNEAVLCRQADLPDGVRP